jgi:hypothetical protein
MYTPGCTDSSYITFPDANDASESADVSFSEILEDVDETKATFIRFRTRKIPSNTKYDIL